MKLISILALTPFALAQYDYEYENGTDYLDPMARRLRSRQDFINFLVPKQLGTIYDKLPAVNGYKYYGCWCLPSTGNTRTPNRGNPVDKIDAACKRAYQCYQCAQRDRPGIRCDMRSTGYDYTLLEGSDPNDFNAKSIQCMNNPDLDERQACKRSVCECEKKLAMELRDLHSEWNVQFHQRRGDDFKAKEVCVVDKSKKNPNSDNGPIECCGHFTGARFPFMTRGGERKCCGDKTFNPLFQTCCDGILTSGGSC